MIRHNTLTSEKAVVYFSTDWNHCPELNLLKVAKKVSEISTFFNKYPLGFSNIVIEMEVGAKFYVSPSAWQNFTKESLTYLLINNLVSLKHES